ncbi:hypothetical protein JTP77_033795, partial [Streptomyces sp. S9]|nr:hypothetical protein [Streptomyces sp. S9]
AVEVEDRGLGMPVDEQSRMNALLADPDQVNVGRLLADGRIGLFVVSQLARRHGIRVRLQGNIYGGVQAVLVVPQALLGGSAPGQLPGPSAETPAHGVRSASPGTGLDVVPRRGAGVNGTGPAASPAVQERPTLPAPHEPRLPRRDRSATASPATPAAQDVPDARVPDGGGPVSGRPAEDGRPGPSDASPEPTRHDPAATHQRGAAPLPVRGAHEERANPAEAVPGIRPGDRAVVEGNAGTVPVPRSGAVRGTMGKPSLPRRRAQEHIVPQLRGGPAPRSDNEEPAGHDPGLMAAFQRGIGLAEAQQSLEAEDLEPGAEESEPLPSWEPLERSPYPVSGALEAALRTASNPAPETEFAPTDTDSSPETRPAISSWSGGLAETSLTGRPAGLTETGSTTEPGPADSPWSGTLGETSTSGRSVAGDPTEARRADSPSAETRSAGSSWATGPSGTASAGQSDSQSQAGNSAEAPSAHRSAGSSWATGSPETPSAGRPVGSSSADGSTDARLTGSSWADSPGSAAPMGGSTDAPPGTPAGTPPAERAVSLSSWAVTPAGASPASPTEVPSADGSSGSSPWAGDSARTPSSGTGWPTGQLSGDGGSPLPRRATPDRPASPARRPLAFGTPAPFTPRLQGAGGEGAGAISEATSPPLAAPGHGAGSDHHTPRHDGSASSG